MKTEGNFTSSESRARWVCVCVFVCFYACVSVCVCSWGVAAQQRRIRAIAQASTSICYAVKMHKNPQTETETGIYLNLCRYNVILHYPRKMMMASASASQLNFPPFYCGACVCVRVCRCVGVCVCAPHFLPWYFYVHSFFYFFFSLCDRLENFCGTAQSPQPKRFLFYLN